jgi:hypothetical protein
VVFDAILNRQPADPRIVNAQLPEDLCRVITRALEKDRRMRYQTAADMLSELGRLRRDTSGRTNGGDRRLEPKPGNPARKRHRRASRFRLPDRRRRPDEKHLQSRSPASWWWRSPAGAGVWYFAGRSSTPVLTERDTVLVADFANTTGDPVFDDALRQAVAVQLQQSPFLTLLSDQRIQRTLRLMQKPPEGPLTPDVAREVCQRAGAKATVEGSIAALGSNFVISLGVHNCQTWRAARKSAGAGQKQRGGPEPVGRRGEGHS